MNHLKLNYPKQNRRNDLNYQNYNNDLKLNEIEMVELDVVAAAVVDDYYDWY